MPPPHTGAKALNAIAVPPFSSAVDDPTDLITPFTRVNGSFYVNVPMHHLFAE